MGNCVQDRKFAIKLKEINNINQDLCQSRDKACSYILHILCIYRYDRYLCYIFCAPKDTMFVSLILCFYKYDISHRYLFLSRYNICMSQFLCQNLHIFICYRLMTGVMESIVNLIQDESSVSTGISRLQTTALVFSHPLPQSFN